MRWISNNDPPIYVWGGDVWYNQKDKITYIADLYGRQWLPHLFASEGILFPKKARIMR